MRIIGHLPDEAKAKSFSDFLWSQSVPNEIEADDSEWAVWVQEEEHVESAAKHLEHFREAPEHPDFTSGSSRAEKVRQEIRDEETKAKKIHTRRDLFVSLEPYGPGQFTCVLIGLCVLLGFLTNFGDSFGRANSLYFTEMTDLVDRVSWNPQYPELRKGEIWRVVTPILLHGSPFHLFFNMWWLFSFGSMIEARKGTGTLVTLIIVSAAISNGLQAKFSGPFFLGISGVNYALFGYLWMKGMFHRGSGMGVEQSTVLILMAWFFLCLTPAIPGVANWCHGGGLVIGLAWGIISSPSGFRQLVDLLRGPR